MATCKVCKRSFVYKHGGCLKDVCCSCYTTETRRKLKQRGVEYLGGKCVRCGYNKITRALCFHHIDASTKEFNLSSSQVLGWEKYRKELDKCILVCLNCHNEIHAGM